MSTPARKLPDKPDLEQLKKQAKDLLKSFRAGDESAHREVIAHFTNPDPATFQLTSAQLVLARAHGFDSWPKLKAFVDGVTIHRFIATVRAGDLPAVRAMLKQRPELIHMDAGSNDEHCALHHAVLQRNVPMVRLLMEAGADPRKGIYPHRDATAALTIAKDRGYDDVVTVIEAEEQRRRETMSCPNVTVSPMQDQINDAIRAGDNAAAMRLLETDEPLIRACDRTGSSPLHIAAATMNVDMVRWLVARRADAKKTNMHNQSPLDVAVDSLRWSRDKCDRFPEVANLLIQRGCEVSPLAATALGDLARLRQWHAQEPARVRESNRILEVAVIAGQLDALRFLLDSGLDSDERYRVGTAEESDWAWGGPIWYAAMFSEYEMARLLLERGADANGVVYAGGVAISHTYKTRDHRMRDLLWSFGGRPRPTDIGICHDLPAASELIAAGDQPMDDITSYGCVTTIETLLWGACNSGDAEIVAMCLPHIRRAPNDVWWNGMLEQPMRLGNDPLEDHPACLKLILDTGVDPNVTRRFNQRALHFLCSRVQRPADQRAFAAILLNAGARLDLRDDLLQSTPLAWAARWGKAELVTFLLQRGAPANEPDAEPWATPLAWATKMNHPEIAATLRQHGATR